MSSGRSGKLAASVHQQQQQRHHSHSPQPHGHSTTSSTKSHVHVPPLNIQTNNNGSSNHSHTKSPSSGSSHHPLWRESDAAGGSTTSRPTTGQTISASDPASIWTWDAILSSQQTGAASSSHRTAATSSRSDYRHAFERPNSRDGLSLGRGISPIPNAEGRSKRTHSQSMSIQQAAVAQQIINNSSSTTTYSQPPPQSLIDTASGFIQHTQRQTATTTTTTVTQTHTTSSTSSSTLLSIPPTLLNKPRALGDGGVMLSYGSEDGPSPYTTTLVPTLRTSEREELTQLSNALDYFVERLDLSQMKHLRLDSRDNVSKLMDLLKEEESIYFLFFDELIRQISEQCRERGEILKKIRMYYSNLLLRIPIHLYSIQSELTAQQTLNHTLQEESLRQRESTFSLRVELSAYQHRFKESAHELELVRDELSRAEHEKERARAMFVQFKEEWESQREALEQQLLTLKEERDDYRSTSTATTLAMQKSLQPNLFVHSLLDESDEDEVRISRRLETLKKMKEGDEKEVQRDQLVDAMEEVMKDEEKNGDGEESKEQPLSSSHASRSGSKRGSTYNNKRSSQSSSGPGSPPLLRGTAASLHRSSLTHPLDPLSLSALEEERKFHLEAAKRKEKEIEEMREEQRRRIREMEGENESEQKEPEQQAPDGSLVPGTLSPPSAKRSVRSSAVSSASRMRTPLAGLPDDLDGAGGDVDGNSTRQQQQSRPDTSSSSSLTTSNDHHHPNTHHQNSLLRDRTDYRAFRQSVQMKGTKLYDAREVVVKEVVEKWKNEMKEEEKEGVEKEVAKMLSIEVEDIKVVAQSTNTSSSSSSQQHHFLPILHTFLTQAESYPYNTEELLWIRAYFPATQISNETVNWKECIKKYLTKQPELYHVIDILCGGGGGDSNHSSEDQEREKKVGWIRRILMEEEEDDSSSSESDSDTLTSNNKPVDYATMISYAKPSSTRSARAGLFTDANELSVEEQSAQVKERKSKKKLEREEKRSKRRKKEKEEIEEEHAERDKQQKSSSVNNDRKSARQSQTHAQDKPPSLPTSPKNSNHSSSSSSKRSSSTTKLKGMSRSASGENTAAAGTQHDRNSIGSGSGSGRTSQKDLLRKDGASTVSSKQQSKASSVVASRESTPLEHKRKKSASNSNVLSVGSSSSSSRATTAASATSSSSLAAAATKGSHSRKSSGQKQVEKKLSLSEVTSTKSNKAQRVEKGKIKSKKSTEVVDPDAENINLESTDQDELEADAGDDAQQDEEDAAEVNDDEPSTPPVDQDDEEETMAVDVDSDHDDNDKDDDDHDNDDDDDQPHPDIADAERKERKSTTPASGTAAEVEENQSTTKPKKSSKSKSKPKSKSKSKSASKRSKSSSSSTTAITSASPAPSAGTIVERAKLKDIRSSRDRSRKNSVPPTMSRNDSAASSVSHTRTPSQSSSRSVSRSTSRSNSRSHSLSRDISRTHSRGSSSASSVSGMTSASEDETAAASVRKVPSVKENQPTSGGKKPLSSSTSLAPKKSQHKSKSSSSSGRGEHGRFPSGDNIAQHANSSMVSPVPQQHQQQQQQQQARVQQQQQQQAQQAQFQAQMRILSPPYPMSQSQATQQQQQSSVPVTNQQQTTNHHHSLAGSRLTSPIQQQASVPSASQLTSPQSTSIPPSRQSILNGGSITRTDHPDPTSLQSFFDASQVLPVSKVLITPLPAGQSETPREKELSLIIYDLIQQNELLHAQRQALAGLQRKDDSEGAGIMPKQLGLFAPGSDAVKMLMTEDVSGSNAGVTQPSSADAHGSTREKQNSLLSKVNEYLQAYRATKQKQAMENNSNTNNNSADETTALSLSLSSHQTRAILSGHKNLLHNSRFLTLLRSSTSNISMQEEERKSSNKKEDKNQSAFILDEEEAAAAAAEEKQKEMELTTTTTSRGNTHRSFHLSSSISSLNSAFSSSSTSSSSTSSSYPLPWLLKWVRSIYDAKLTRDDLCRASNITIQPLPEFLLDMQKKRYGLDRICRRKTEEVLKAMMKWRSGSESSSSHNNNSNHHANTELTTFLEFLEESRPLDELLLFLRTRQLILNCTVGVRWQGHVNERGGKSSGSSSDGQTAIYKDCTEYLSLCRVRSILSTIFSSSTEIQDKLYKNVLSLCITWNQLPDALSMQQWNALLSNTSAASSSSSSASVSKHPAQIDERCIRQYDLLEIILAQFREIELQLRHAQWAHDLWMSVMGKEERETRGWKDTGATTTNTLMPLIPSHTHTNSTTSPATLPSPTEIRMSFTSFQQIFSLSEPRYSSREIAQLYSNITRQSGLKSIPKNLFVKLIHELMNSGRMFPLLKQPINYEVNLTIRLIIRHYNTFLKDYLQYFYDSLIHSKQEEDLTIAQMMKVMRIKFERELVRTAAGGTSGEDENDDGVDTSIASLTRRLLTLYRGLLNLIISHQNSSLLSHTETPIEMLHTELKTMQHMIVQRHRLVEMGDTRVDAWLERINTISNDERISSTESQRTTTLPIVAPPPPDTQRTTSSARIQQHQGTGWDSTTPPASSMRMR